MTATARRPGTSDRTRRLIDELHQRALRTTLSSLPSQEPRDYLYDLLPEYPARPGKGLRPVLCMAACAAYGGSYDDALPFAAALELLHNAFLIHDDIQDGSRVRRGAAALHEKHGVPLALNAGDALAATATSAFLRALRPLRPRVAAALADGWEHMVAQTIEGQAMDLGWQHDNVVDVSVADYLSMCGRKTAWYTTIQPLAIGAVVGSGLVERERDTFQFGWLLGLLFQIANDIDGVRAAGGGAAGESEIEEGKRTILVIHLLDTLTGDERAEAVRIMNLPRAQRGAAEVDWMRTRLEAAGSLDHARACVSTLADAASAEADRVFGALPPSDARELLLGITGYVLEKHGLGDAAEPVRAARQRSA